MSPLLTNAAKLILKLSGWTVVGRPPVEEKFMCLAAPHTSLWDGLWMVLAAFSFGFKPDFLVKSTYVEGRFGRAILWAGGIPVLAGAGANKVEQVVAMVNERETVRLLLAPAGTRSKRAGWRSGFYHIAKGTGLPIYLTFLDFSTRTLGINDTPLYLSDNVKADMERIRAFYADKIGKHPDKMTSMSIREEEAVLEEA